MAPHDAVWSRPAHLPWRVFACLALAAWAPFLRADVPPHDPLLAADEQTLWLLRVTEDRTDVLRRDTTGPFELQPELHAPVTRAAAARGTLYVFASDGAHYALTETEWLRRPDLRGRIVPIALAGGERALYALIPSPAPGDYPRLADAAVPAASQPFDPGDAPFSILQYDSRGWLAVASAPREMTTAGAGAPTPQLYVHAAADDRALYIHWMRGPVGHCWFLAPGASAWEPIPFPTDIPTDGTAWFVTANRLPTLVVAGDAAAGAPALAALRLLTPAGASTPVWNPVPIDLSAWSATEPPRAYRAACGFNQHVALLAQDAQGDDYLRFMHVGGPAAEPTVSIAELFARPSGAAGPHLIQTAAWAVLVGILTALVFFRRGALVQTLPLAAEWAPGFTFQRLLGCLIDLAPFALVSAALLKVDALTSARQLSDWSWGQRGATPTPLPTLWWWLLTTVTSTLYCLVMELVTRRTLGKLITGTYVLSESGAPASPLQVVVRNVLRFIELQPPLFWLLGFLVILSRNRQRAGDMFAHTVVVRRIRPPTRDGDGG